MAATPSTEAQSSASPSAPSGKTSAAPPKVSTHKSGVELENLTDSAAEGSGNAASNNKNLSLPVEEDIMQLARLGETNAIRKLFDSGKFSPKYCDEEDITPLHWAAINNRYELCKFLLDSGAEVNARGGESAATPAMWAAQRCHYYVVNLLLEYGADPLLTDVQGYNILHLATIDGNAYLLVLLLHQEIPVDVTDPQGHTGLMWAAYKGYPACVDLFLRWGANVNAEDEGGLAPLHWALVKGSTPCVQKIIDYGADRFAATRDGKTPEVVAGEMKTTSVWYRALSECGYSRQGNAISLPLGLGGLLRDKKYISKFFFLWPFAMLFVALYILSTFSIFLSVPLTIVALIAMQSVAVWVVNRGPAEYRVLQRTPFLAGVFAGSLFWVAVRWLIKVLPGTYSSLPFWNVSFALLLVSTIYFYIYCVTEDPGYVPKLPSRSQQRETISELFKLWKFDEDNFCVYCMIRKPLRSKHCRRCKRCVSKHDHHCPWIDTCVAANNLRHFILYIFSMEIGIGVFVRLIVGYIASLPPPSDTECNFLSFSLCSVLKRDTFTILLTGWLSVHLIWVTMLCVVQLVQVSRNQTTYENMKGHSIEYSHPTSQAITSALMTGTTSLDVSGQGPNPSIPSSSRRRPPNNEGCFSQWKKLFGLDTFFATAQDGLTADRRRRNPFSRGVVTNCRDFWCDPAPYFGQRESGSAMLEGEVVNYNRMYDVPLMLRTGSRAGPGMVYRSVAHEERELEGV